MQDQATALRQIVQSRYEGALGASGGGQVVAVASGKGGVGKTNLSVNLAIALRRNGQRVAGTAGEQIARDALLAQLGVGE